MSEQPPFPPDPQQPGQPYGEQPGQPYGQQPPQPYGQPYQQPYGQPGYGYPMAPPPTPGSATTALILGIVGVVLCPLFASIPALFIGRNALKEIDASQGQLGGRGTAQAGWILGIVGTVIGSLAVLAFVGLFALGLAVEDSLEDTCDEINSDGYYSIEC